WSARRGEPISVITWDSVDQFSDDPDYLKHATTDADRKRLESPKGEYRNPANAIMLVEDNTKVPENAIFIFRDLDEYLLPAGNEPLRRRLRSIAEQYRISNSEIHHTLIIISAQLNIPDKLKQSITVLEYQLPTMEEHCLTVDYVVTSIKHDPKSKSKP